MVAYNAPPSVILWLLIGKFVTSMTIQGSTFTAVKGTDSFVLEFALSDGTLTGGVRIGGAGTDSGIGMVENAAVIRQWAMWLSMSGLCDNARVFLVVGFQSFGRRYPSVPRCLSLVCRCGR